MFYSLGIVFGVISTVNAQSLSPPPVADTQKFSSEELNPRISGAVPIHWNIEESGDRRRASTTQRKRSAKITHSGTGRDHGNRMKADIEADYIKQ